MSSSLNNISILGCGWLGLPLGESLVKKGYTVKGSTTKESKLPFLKGKGIHPFLLKVNERIEGNPSFFQSDLLILNIPPGRRRKDVATHYPNETALVLDAARNGGVQKILFVSTTGVYANNGQVATEREVPEPSRPSGQGLWAAEKLVQKEEMQCTVVRLAGLAGEGRNPGSWFAGKKDLKGGASPVNLVHLEDCIQAIELILEKEAWGKVYNLCADKHPLKRDYYPYMAEKAGLEKPTFVSEDITPFKIVSNEKAKRELGLKLKFPDPNLF